MSIDSLSLPHNFIHQELSEKALKQLKKLTHGQILEHLKRWGEDFEHTPPSPAEEDSDEDVEMDDEEVGEEGDKRRRKAQRVLEDAIDEGELDSCSKSTLIQLITQEYWRDGLSLYQVADIESTFLLESKQANYAWYTSTIYTAKDDVYLPVIEPTRFVEALQSALYPLAIGHIYATAHQPLSLTLVRIQLFEPKPQQLTGPLRAAKPIYIAFPPTSGVVLHTVGDPYYNEAIKAALKASLSIPSVPIKINSSGEIPTSNLHTLACFKGGKRGVDALGAWSVYADNLVDSSPLNNQSRPKQKSVNTGDDEQSKRRKEANLKFTGRDESTGVYKSRDPQSIFEVKIKEPCGSSSYTPSITLRFEGEDVFAGMHKLAADGVVDGAKLPSFMTGQESASSGVVSNGQFQAHH